MRLVVSFDTEDFTDPVSNDALLRICQALTTRGIRASFGLVGEKARFLRDEGRADVIEALSHHAICYHTENHFLFPDDRHQPRFASEIIEECDWEEAVRWLVATEGRGLADIEELLGRRPITFLRTCGDSAPQILEAYRRLGLHVFAYGPSLHERTRHIAWYGNQLAVSLPLLSEEDTYAGRGPAELDKLVAAGEDLVNVRFHPCRFIADEWWDVVNFLGNFDPPTRPPYALAPRVAPDETDRRLHHLGALMDYAWEKHGARFTTYDDLWRQTPRDPAFLSRAQVKDAAGEALHKLSFLRTDWVTLSLAEVFGVIVWAALHPQADQIPLRRLVGPIALPSGKAKVGARLTADDIIRACREAEEEIEAKGRVPHQVMLGGAAAPPAALLKAAAAQLLGETQITLTDAPIFPEGFDDLLRRWEEASFDLVAFFPNRNRPTPNTKTAVKLQYWTYKPAE